MKDVEAVGDVDTQLINFIYMALLGRKHEDVELTREWAQRISTLADKAKNVVYKVHALGSLAWVDLYTGNEQQVQVYIQQALVLNERAPSPIQFMVLGPALAVEVKRKNWDAAVEYVEALLHPGQQKMPDDIQSMLEQAIVEWKEGDIEATETALFTEIEMMRQKKFGYV